MLTRGIRLIFKSLKSLINLSPLNSQTVVVYITGSRLPSTTRHTLTVGGVYFSAS